MHCSDNLYNNSTRIRRRKEEEDGAAATDYQLECKFLENVVCIFSLTIENRVQNIHKYKYMLCEMTSPSNAINKSLDETQKYECFSDTFFEYGLPVTDKR